jgi:glutamate-1-semialdehyde 2,1-aminomutase
MSQSSELFSRAERVIPGGVNSPVRAFRAVGGTPRFIARAEGAYLYDEDNVKYIDYIGSWGPMILGHAHPDVVRAIQTAATRGTSYGAPTALEVQFAEAVTSLYPSIDMVRAVSSGTEATMAAIRVARGYTDRDVIIKFEGCYHGHADFLLVKAGSGAATFGVPDSRGVPAATAQDTLTLPFNDARALASAFETRGTEIAAVIVEPVVGNMGCVPPKDGFLAAIIDLCTRNNAVSIFDEVMTGCRLSKSGMQGRVGLSPDMTCLGKIIGGGMPLAAYGGRRAIMEKVAPLGPVYQAGTLSGNPIAVSAALETLKHLDDALYCKLEHLTAQLEEGLKAAVAEAKIEACVQRVGSMLTLFFARGPIHNWDDAKRSNTALFGHFHQGMLARGHYFPPAQFEAAFVSGAHTEADIASTVNAARDVLRELGTKAPT